MSVATSDITKAQEKVLGSVQEPKSVNEEPVSGVKGAGTADEPYDQGNQAEQTANPGTEPVSGKTGKGTADSPYDQGNQPEEELSIVDKLSRTKTPKDTPTRPMSIVDQLSRTKPPKASIPQLDTKSSQTNGTSTPTPTITEQPASPVEQTESRKMSLIDQLSRTKTKAERAADKQKKTDTVEEEQERGRDDTSTPTTASNPNNEKLKPRPRPVFERSISPGELNDGTHVRCSGDRGESYTPPGKLMSKLHIGKH